MRASGARPDGYLMQKVISACEKVGAWEEADVVRTWLVSSSSAAADGAAVLQLVFVTTLVI